MSLRKKIILVICATIILMMLILSGLIYTKSARILNRSAAFQMQSQLERAKENIDLRLQITKLETEKLSLDEKVVLFCQGKLDVGALNTYLTEKMALMDDGDGYYKDLFIMDLDGVIRATTMEEAQDIDLSSRAYLAESQRTLETITSDALIARSDGSLIVNTVTPIYDSGGIVLGHAGIAIKAEYFSKIVSDLKIGEDGYYGIVDSNNRILAHPDKSLIYKKLPKEISNQHAGQISDYLSTEISVYKGASIFEPEKNAFQCIEYIDSNRWYLIASLPERELYSQSMMLLSYVIIAGAVGIVVAVLIGYYTGSEISKPIVAVTETLKGLTVSNARIEAAIRTSVESIRREEDNGIETQGVDVHADSYEAEKRADEIGNLRSAVNMARDYLSSATGIFERESQKLTAESKQIMDSVSDMSYNTARFIATLSHDLKTSVTLIKGYAKGLNLGIIDDAKARQKFLNGILTSAEDIEWITCDILDNAYEAQCVPNLRLETRSLRGLSDELSDTFELYCTERERRPVVAISGVLENQEIKVDSVKIKRVWQNILSNAVKYSTEESQIDCEIAVVSETKVRLSIRDRGCGIREADLKRLQEMFYRGRGNDQKGYGLGLFIAGSILEAHNSSLEIESVLGVGTLVAFDLSISGYL